MSWSLQKYPRISGCLLPHEFHAQSWFLFLNYWKQRCSYNLCNSFFITRYNFFLSRLENKYTFRLWSWLCQEDRGFLSCIFFRIQEILWSYVWFCSLKQFWNYFREFFSDFAIRAISRKWYWLDGNLQDFQHFSFYLFCLLFLNCVLTYISKLFLHVLVIFAFSPILILTFFFNFFHLIFFVSLSLFRVIFDDFSIFWINLLFKEYFVFYLFDYLFLYYFLLFDYLFLYYFLLFDYLFAFLFYFWLSKFLITPKDNSSLLNQNLNLNRF